MTNITKIILFGLLLICISCTKEFTSPELQKSFSPTEISDFKTITEFFTQQICRNNEKSEFKSCFEKILPELIERDWNPILEKIDFEKQKELYQSISKSTFDKIWGYRKIWTATNRVYYKTIEITRNGEYLNYLKNVEDKYKYISKYTDRIHESGGIEAMGLLQNHIYLNPEDLDLNDINIQILISIHYLTLNGEENMEEIWE